LLQPVAFEQRPEGTANDKNHRYAPSTCEIDGPDISNAVSLFSLASIARLGDRAPVRYFINS
jgi:hypothetical protein